MQNDELHFLPQALDPDGMPWAVHEVDALDSSVDLAKKIANVPKARTRANEQIRLHEMAHVGYSDQHQHDSDMATFICRMVEEVRVDALLYKIKGIDVRHRHDDFEWKFGELETTPFARAMAWLQTCFHTTNPTISEDVKAFNKACWLTLTPGCQVLIRAAMRDMMADPENTALREEHVRAILKFFAPPPPKVQEKPKTKKPEVIQEESDQIQKEQKEQKEQEQAEKEAQDRKKKPGVPPPQQGPTLEELHELNKLGQSPDHTVQTFGGAEVHDHIARLKKVTQVKAPFTSTGRGITPEFMENYLVNKRVFRTEHRGGVIVLDCSGSMSPDFEKITAQMYDFPNLAVLSYVSTTFSRSINSKGLPSGINGRICVHARNGRIDPVFRREPGESGGNAVDIEAMEYGGKFKGPRVWVSDGHAHSGNYDSPGPWHAYEGGMQRKVRETMKRFHYIRVTNLDDALAWITRSRPVVYYLCGTFDEGANPSGSYYLDETGKDTRKGRRP